MNSTIAQEVTEWYPADVKPVHVGVYEVQNMYDPTHPNLFNYWTGKEWTGSASHIESLVMESRPHICAFQGRVWRGLRRPA